MIVISWFVKDIRRSFTTDKDTRKDAEKLVKSLKADKSVKKISAIEEKKAEEK